MSKFSLALLIINFVYFKCVQNHSDFTETYFMSTFRHLLRFLCKVFEEGRTIVVCYLTAVRLAFGKLSLTCS